jgi:hypothetical protein
VAHVTLVPGDRVFAGLLADALSAEGHEVEIIDNPAYVVPPPRAADALEIAVTEATGSHRGIRIRVVGLPKDTPYAGPLGQFLADPVEVADVMTALALFVGQP